MLSFTLILCGFTAAHSLVSLSSDGVTVTTGVPATQNSTSALSQVSTQAKEKNGVTLKYFGTSLVETKLRLMARLKAQLTIKCKDEKGALIFFVIAVICYLIGAAIQWSWSWNSQASVAQHIFTVIFWLASFIFLILACCSGE